jgi:hypothetical protein
MQYPAPRVATVVVTIDIDQTVADCEMLTGLLDVLRRYRTPAMWSFEFQRQVAAIDQICETCSSQEFGLLATRRWADPRASRTAFSRELAQRLSCADRLGIRTNALALQDSEPPVHLDLLVKRQIPLLRLRTDSVTGATHSLQPRLARYGIWQSAPTIVVPVQSRWSLPWTTRGLLHRAAERGQTLHIAVDGVRLARNATAGLATLDYLLRQADARRDGGKLQIVAASQLLMIYAPQRAAVPSRSVLHAA